MVPGEGMAIQPEFSTGKSGDIGVSEDTGLLGVLITKKRVSVFDKDGFIRCYWNEESTINVPESKPLSHPRSGWIEFMNFLEKQGIDSPMRLSRERSDYLRSPDVQVIMFESKFDDAHSLVFFHLDNPSDDAQRALAVCRRIEHEFNLNMHCGSSPG